MSLGSIPAAIAASTHGFTMVPGHSQNAPSYAHPYVSSTASALEPTIAVSIAKHASSHGVFILIILFAVMGIPI